MTRRAWLAGCALVAGVALLGARIAWVEMGSASSSLSITAGARPVQRADGAADPVRGADVFRACSACHTLGRGGPDVDGPNLYGVVGAPIAERRPRYGYTQALRDVGGLWTRQRLDAWLTAPAAFAPGTAMHFAGLADPEDRADVIAYLATQGPVR